MMLLFLPFQDNEEKRSKKKKKGKRSSSKKKAETKAQSPKADSAATSASSDTLLVQKAAVNADTVAFVKPQVETDLFKGHSLTVRNDKPIPVQENSVRENWFPVLIVFIVLLISLVNLFYQKKFREFIASLFRRYSPQGMREDNVFTQRLRILLFLIFCLVTSAFIYESTGVYQLRPSKLTGFQFYNVILFIVFFLYLLKIGLVRLMGFIFKAEREYHDYNNNILLYLNILSLGLLPLVVLIGFSDSLRADLLVKTGWVFILCAILFRIGRGYVMAVSNPLLSKFYLFIYLCTLEILPLVVILKMFVGQLL